MFIIGVDPHRGSHVAVVLDDHQQIHYQLGVDCQRSATPTAVGLAADHQPRLWAIEGAARPAALLAQQLLAAGEQVIDVPAALARAGIRSASAALVWSAVAVLGRTREFSH